MRETPSIRLRERGKRIVMLSNAPRRAAMVAASRSPDSGIEPELYDGVMTSGEVCLGGVADPH